MSITKKRKYSMSGGIPVYPGGFSCVFKPQLKCNSKNKNSIFGRNLIFFI
jgi:hypothetical protein